MDRKIRVIILTMVLTVLMFGGTRLMAEDIPSETLQTAPNEGNLEPEGEKGASLVSNNKDTKIDSNKADAKEDAGKTESTEAEANKNTSTEVSEPKASEDAPKQEEKTEAKTPADKKADKPAEKAAGTPDVKPADKTAEGNGPEDGAKLQASPAKVPEAQGAPAKGEEAKTGEGEGEPKKPTDPKPEVDPSKDDELKALQAQIDAANDAKDTKKAAELQKEYNEKLFKKIEKTGSDKYADDTAKRLTDKDKIALYNQIKEKKKELDEKLKAGTLTTKDVNDFNKLLGGFTPPRALTEKESEAAQKIGQEPYYPGFDEEGYDKALKAAEEALRNDPTNESKKADLEKIKNGKKVWDDYKEARKALEDAINPENEAKTDAEISDLLNKFNSTIAPLKEAIGDGSLQLKFAKVDGKPEIWIFPIGDDGRVNPNFGYGKDEHDWQNDGEYYIPDNTDLKLIVQVNRNNADENSSFKFTITPNRIGKYEPNPKIDFKEDIAYINGEPIKLDENEDGTYSFTVDADKTNFGIAQLTLKVNGFTAPFHNGFELKMENKVGDKVVESKTKKFLITKKGYEDNAELNGPGTKKPKDHELTDPEKKEVSTVNAGTTENGIVVENAKALEEFFVELEKAHGYIDKKILVNSSNGKSLPLSSVEITIKVPEYNGNFAEFINKSDLEYVKIAKGEYQLKLKVKEIGGNLAGKTINENTELNDVILVDKDGNKVYIGSDGKLLREDPSNENSDPIKVEEREVLTGTIDSSNYEIVGGELTVGSSKANKVEGQKDTWTLDGRTYKLEGDKLISYTDVKDVYEGNVSNKKNDETNEFEADPSVTPTYKGTQVIVKKTDDGKTQESYGGTIINGGVFKIIGSDKDKEYKYIGTAPSEWKGKTPEGYEKKDGFVLIDKFGLLMDGVEIKINGGVYTFIKKHNNKVEKRTTGATCSDGLELTVEENKQFYVDNKNIIVEKDINATDSREAIIGKKYYYDGSKFVEVDKDGVRGDMVYVDYKYGVVEEKATKFYNKNKPTETVDVSDTHTTLYGSNDPSDYVKIDGKIYFKEKIDTPAGEEPPSEPKYRYIFAGIENSADIISEEKTHKIVQIIKDENGKEYEKLTDETSIFDAVRKAKFQLKLPGFLAGDTEIYNIQADIKANYFAPNPSKPGEFIEKSIFAGEDSTENEYISEDTYSLKKHFKIQINEKGLGFFFKDHPKEFDQLPDYNLFNIIYRDGSDRKRDEFIKALVELREKHNPETEADKEKAKKIKEQIEFLEKLEKSLSTLYGKEGLKFVKDGENLVVKDGDETFEVKRSLLWEVGFNNEKGILFPIDSDIQLTIDDYNMDNRLVYDEIIINNTKEEWERAEKKDETKQYFFLDQISKIILGVNPDAKTKSEDKLIDINRAGDEFVLTQKDIKDALASADAEGKTKIEKIYNYTVNGDSKQYKVTYSITVDKERGQIRLKVLDAFYNKNFRDDKFKSPVQKAYEDSIDKLNKAVDEFTFEEGGELKTKEKLKEDFGNLIAKVFPADTSCYKTITGKFYELLNDKADVTDKKAFLEEIKQAINEADAKLKYSDPNHLYDDMGYNGIRFILEPNIQIGGPLDVAKIKKVGITSVLVPEVDIPYTDEFGKALTNKDILEEGSDKPAILVKVKDDNGVVKNEQEIEGKVLRPAGDDFIFFYKDKYEIPYYIYSAKLGGDLKFTDLAIKGEDGKYKALLDVNGNQINKYYGKTGTEKSGARVDLKEITDPKVKAIIEEILDSPIDLYSYYIHENGPNRALYKNEAGFKLAKFDQAPKIFGDEDNWKYRICPEGILGHCLESGGADGRNKSSNDNKLAGTGGKTGDEVKLSYTPQSPGTDEENPKFDKTNPNPDKKDININESRDMNVDFTIDTTVDKLKKEEQEAKNYLIEDKEEREKADKKLEEDVKKGYYDKDGYFVYKNSFIIDVLPDIFQITNDTKINLKLNKDALTANGANKDLADDDKLEAFKKQVKYIYVEDVDDYLSKITDSDQREALRAAIEAKGIKKGQRAIIVKLPEFQAPHGSARPQFTVEIKNLLVDRKKYKEAESKNNKGQIYTNHGLFSGEGIILYDNENTTVTDGHKGNVNKYLRVVDEKGNPVSDEELGNWFKGNVELKFGDKFDYKIKVRKTNNLVDTGYGNSNNLTEWEMTDKLPDNVNGLRPILRDFVKVPDNLEVFYKINGKSYTEDDIKAGKAKLSDVTEITIKLKEGRTFKVNEDVSFEIPMEILDMDAKIEKGKIKYIGTDGKEVIKDAEEFFKLGDFKDKDKDLFGKNSVEKSNEVRVYLEKQKFVKIFKEFFDSEGKRITEGLPDELEFIITDENGKSETIILKKENNFEGKSGYLPWFKKTVTFDENGNAQVKEEEIKYNYTLKEKDSKGYILEVENISEDEYKIAIAFKAKNTEPEEPEYPGDNPKKEPKKVTVTIRVNKTWEVLNNGSTPSIQVELYANGKATGKKFTLGDGNWSATFKDLPSKDDDGNPIEYTVVEVGSANGITMIEDRKFEVIYSTNADGSITILNKEVPNEEEKDKKEPKKEEPHDDEEEKDRDQGKNKLPKTGVAEDLASIYFAFVLLLGLVFIKKRYLVK